MGQLNQINQLNQLVRVHSPSRPPSESGFQCDCDPPLRAVHAEPAGPREGEGECGGFARSWPVPQTAAAQLYQTGAPASRLAAHTAERGQPFPSLSLSLSPAFSPVTCFDGKLMHISVQVVEHVIDDMLQTSSSSEPRPLTTPTTSAALYAQTQPQSSLYCLVQHLHSLSLTDD